MTFIRFVSESPLPRIPGAKPSVQESPGKSTLDCPGRVARPLPAYFLLRSSFSVGSVFRHHCFALSGIPKLCPEIFSSAPRIAE